MISLTGLCQLSARGLYYGKAFDTEDPPGFNHSPYRGAKTISLSELYAGCPGGGSGGGLCPQTEAEAFFNIKIKSKLIKDMSDLSTLMNVEEWDQFRLREESEDSQTP